MRRTLLLAVVIMLLATSGASAQSEALKKTTPEQRAAVQTEFMTKKLSLTPEERSQVSALNLSYAQKMQPILTGNGGPFEKMRQARQLEQEKDADLNKVLTPQQYQSYLSLKEALRKRVEAAFAK